MCFFISQILQGISNPVNISGWMTSHLRKESRPTLNWRGSQTCLTLPSNRTCPPSRLSSWPSAQSCCLEASDFGMSTFERSPCSRSVRLDAGMRRLARSWWRDRCGLRQTGWSTTGREGCRGGDLGRERCSRAGRKVGWRSRRASFLLSRGGLWSFVWTTL